MLGGSPQDMYVKGYRIPPAGMSLPLIKDVVIYECVVNAGWQSPSNVSEGVGSLQLGCHWPKLKRLLYMSA